MTVFISHSFGNRPEFDNVADALTQRAIPYWDPDEVQTGAGLREQLRQAVEQCCLCIFVATYTSVDSSWCGAELGAFWGTGKPILVYLAEASLPKDRLPAIVQGDVWERSLPKIAERARDIHNRAHIPNQSGNPMAASVASLTLEQFEKLIHGAVSLAAATAMANGHELPRGFTEVSAAATEAAGKVLAGFQATENLAQAGQDGWQNRILWVDDRPKNNTFLVQAMEAMGLQVTLALSTNEALRILADQRFAAIISDMGRHEGPREGYVLLDAVRKHDTTTPYFIFAGSNSAEHRHEAIDRGAQGSTNRADDLLELVTRALPKRPA